MTRQLTFDLFSEPTSAYSPAIAAALAALSAHGDGEARGAVFTRVEVVEFILDLVGYTVDQPLHRRRLSAAGGRSFADGVARVGGHGGGERSARQRHPRLFAIYHLSRICQKLLWKLRRASGSCSRSAFYAARSLL